MTNKKQLSIGALLSYLSIAINIIAGLIYTPWMVQKIGQSDYGLYTLANSLITLFLVDFGFSFATARYVSKYRAEGDQKKVDNFLGAIYKLYFVITSVIFILLFMVYFFIDTIYTQLTPVEIERFKVVYVISATFAVINFPFVTFNGILTSYEKFVQLKLADILYRISFVGSTIIALALGYGLYALVALHAIVGLLIVLYKYIVIKKHIPVKVNFKYSEKGMYKEIFSFSIWVTLSTISTRLIFNITPSVLGMTADSGAIAIFGIVTTVEMYVYMVISAIDGMFMPRISQIIIDDEKRLQPLLLKVGKYLYILNGLIVAGFTVVGQLFIKLWVGAMYIDAYWGILLVIVPGMFYNSLQIAHTTVVATKRVYIHAWVNVVIGVINIILSFAFSKSFGVIGACASIFVAYMVRAILINVVYHKILPFNMLKFAKKCYVKMSLPIIATIFVGMCINMFIQDGGWIIFIVKGIIVVFIYTIFVYLLGFGKSERKLIIQKIKTAFSGLKG